MSPFILTKDGTSRGGAKKHLGAPESFFLAATAFGTVLIVAAVGCALTGSRPTLYAAVAARVAVAVTSLTRPPRRGRLVAALVLPVSAGGFLALILARPDRLLCFVGCEFGWVKITSHVVS